MKSLFRRKLERIVKHRITSLRIAPAKAEARERKIGRGCSKTRVPEHLSKDDVQMDV